MTHHASVYQLDKRSQKSWHKIRAAFEVLVLSERYDEITAGDIIEKAGVSRSTFYSHFENKNAVLGKSLHPPLSVLANCIDPNSPIEPLRQILQHFWEHRSFCRLILTGTPRKAVNQMLIELLEQQIIENLNANQKQILISEAHAATQIAASQLALLDTWLLGKAASSDKKLAEAMKKTSIGLLTALISD
ncbi:TetR/AcrR family transcriptional regulator [Alteromonadaceae bacterium M269]|nr:TetR/AcrR family transcriptional regulator [Alteromonadaceae bacterium M269]